jgi:hypothetical protein
MLQFEDAATPLEMGLESVLEDLAEAFPDADGSCDLCGYASGRVCIFLSLLTSGMTLPARHRVAGILRQMADQVLAGRTVFPMELAPFDRAGLRRLADVFAEVVIDGIPRGFPLIEGHHENDGAIGICVSQGFCDLVLGRWDHWGATSAGSDSDDHDNAASWASPMTLVG